MKPNRAARRAKQREWKRRHPLVLRTCTPTGVEGLYDQLLRETIAYQRKTVALFDPMGGTFANPMTPERIAANPIPED